jgi:hypothetical protein
MSRADLTGSVDRSPRRFRVSVQRVASFRVSRAGRADPNVAAWADGVEAAALYLSVITIQELEIGVLFAERRDPAQGACTPALAFGRTGPHTS